MTVEDIGKRVFAQYPSLKAAAFAEVGIYLRCFSAGDLDQLFGYYQKTWTGTFAPNLGEWKQLVGRLGLKQAKSVEDSERQSSHYVLRCNKCHAYREESPGGRCPNCGTYSGYEIVQTLSSAFDLNRERYGSAQGPGTWEEKRPSIFSANYKAWVLAHGDHGPEKETPPESRQKPPNTSAPRSGVNHQLEPAELF